MMDMPARNQYLCMLITQRGGYHLKSKTEKSQILDEYCRTTGQHRKAVSAKIRSGAYVESLRHETGQVPRTRTTPYDREVVAYLVQLWEIFDRPCGQRLAPMIKSELDRLQQFGELTISDAMTRKLKTICPRTIDKKLKVHKQKERIARKYEPTVHPLLYQKIPVKLAADQGRGIGDSIQIDLVEHCGSSPAGGFISSLSTTDIGSGWWEGDVVVGKGMWGVSRALGSVHARFPFPWCAIHSDNDSAFINDLVWRYARTHRLDFSRSRPYAKNDNCFVEQKNSTHVRKIVGHHRFDTRGEYAIIKSLYQHELRLYKNFFQPVIPLIAKERIGGHVRRRYGVPKTPYQRIMEAPEIAGAVKAQLIAQYQSLNPAALKRQIVAKQDLLYQAYRKKQRAQNQRQKVEPGKNFTPRLAINYLAEPMQVRQQVLVA